MGPTPRPPSATPVFQGVALAFSALFVGAFLLTALARLTYPYDLEWIEGWMLQHVDRLRQGQPVYVPPSLAFIPANYSPLHWQVSAAVAEIASRIGLGGDGLPWMRLASLLAALGTLGAIAAIVWRETRSAAAAAIAAGLFAATYARSGFWFDLARGDSLYLLLLLGAVATLAGGHAGTARSAFAGVFMGLAALTRQSAVVALAPVALLLLVTTRRRALPWLLAATIVGGGGLLAWQIATDGWFGFYVFQVALAHGADYGTLPRILMRDALPFVPLAAVTVWALLRGDRPPSLFGWAVVAGLVGSSLYLRLFPGGWLNVLMPAHAALAWGGARAWAAAEARAPEPRRLVPHAIRATVLVQFALLLYDPRPAIPTPADRAAGDALVARLRAERGPVLVLSHGGLAERAGHAPQFFEMALEDVAALRPPFGPALQESLIAAVRQRRWSAVIVDAEEVREPLVETIATGYAPAETLFGDPGVFWTRSGARTRPETIWRPLSPAPVAPASPPASR